MAVTMDKHTFWLSWYSSGNFTWDRPWWVSGYRIIDGGPGDFVDNALVSIVAAVIQAIRMLRGVASVSTHVADLTEHIAIERARCDLGEKLWRVLYPESK